jgi:hypothetical protein
MTLTASSRTRASMRMHPTLSDQLTLQGMHCLAPEIAERDTQRTFRSGGCECAWVPVWSWQDTAYTPTGPVFAELEVGLVFPWS